MLQINILVFDNFEPLDVFGPMEIFLNAADFQPRLFTLSNSPLVTSFREIKLQVHPLRDIDPQQTLLIPGGDGTRTYVHDKDFLQELQNLAHQAQYCLSVCTGSALLAATDFLNGKRATSNKAAFNWVTSINSKVHWQPHARWVVDGNCYTSSGISAGMDMTFAFLEEIQGSSAAEHVAQYLEYSRIKNPDNDPFAVD